MRALPLLIVFAACAACTQFPELDRTVSPDAEAADYPALVPIEPLLAQADAAQIDAPATTQALSARVAGLRARAAALRGAVVGDADRARLGSAVQ
ncbi:hypothetical protein FDT80_05975 [Sulfitobacter sabulilitoris]|uniref:Uncharacterized protein n=2 Tax=Sulfitobacter sabulilitoris TaxID=2562655 RepID=A0A5S3PL09_9RHOB|nr:hypothetical protein FDT80_05975 [Sulfitobacter sabulilitoris]